MKTRLIFLLILLKCFDSFPQNTDNNKVYLLKESNGVLHLETMQISEGETKSLEQSEFITFILPVGPGKSGNIIQGSDGDNTVKFFATNGELKVSVVKPDGSERKLPSVNFDDLRNYLIRVNIIKGTGLKKAFFIKNYDEYGEANGPVFDLFGGKIPLADDDYSFTTEVTELKQAVYISGSAPLEISDNLLFVKVKINKEKEGYFIIDFGAGRTLLSKESVAPGSQITEIRSIEYSSEGTKISRGEVGAAGGNVPGLLGNTVIDNFSFGTLELNDLSVSVVEKLPAISGREILGIIGMDILQSAPFVTIEYNYGNPGKIIFDKDYKATGNYKNIPFSLTGKQIFINGQINNSKLSFLFDTGARYSFVSEGLGLSTTGKKAPDVRGLDGNIIPAKSVDVKNFSLGNSEFQFKDFYSSDLPVINNMGLKESGGLLGGDFFKEFSKVIVDYAGSVICLE